MNLLLVPIVVVGCFIAAIFITLLIVEVADAFGLVYSAQREERRHRDDDVLREPRALVPVMAPVGVLDLDDPVVRRALLRPPPSRTPILDRMFVAPSRRCVFGLSRPERAAKLGVGGATVTRWDEEERSISNDIDHPAALEDADPGPYVRCTVKEMTA